MKKVLFGGIVSLLLLMNACGPDTPTETNTTVTLNFQGLYGNDEFLFFKDYDYENGDSIFINTAHFFISDITLLNGNESIKIKDIAVLDFSKNHVIAGGTGEKIVIDGVPAGQYTGVRFGIGVDSVLNHTTPADYGVGEPLANASEYWDWRETYIFGKLEGQLKKSNGNEISYTYHPGTDALYRTATFSKTFTLENEIPKTLNFSVDLGMLFNQNNGKIDIETTPISHTGDTDFWLVELIMNNLAAAFQIK